MKRTFLLLMSILVWTAIVSAQNQEYRLRHDSLYVYTSWEQMFDNDPYMLVVNPEITANTEFNVEFDGIKKDLRKTINDESVAVALGDTVWYINTKWLKNNFKGECKQMKNFVPLYFSAKIAFMQWGKPLNFGQQFLQSLIEEGYEYNEVVTRADLYLINFENNMVEKINSDKLSDMLSIYRDLQRRYDSMGDYKESYMIANFFLQYVQRINEDPNIPYLF